MKPLRIALLYNHKGHVPLIVDGPEDALAEYDSEETIQGLQDALRSGGHEVIPLEGDEGFLDAIRQVQPDICFNICEGLRGDSRESHVPAILEMLNVPYTASKVLTQAISLDKVATKRLWRDSGLPIAPFQVFTHPCQPLDSQLSFPLFVKPSHEGTGMGINERSVVRDEASLREQVRWIVDTYHQPALVESYLPGREFTVGLVGNALVAGELPPSDFYNARGYHLFPVLEIDVRHLGGEDQVYTSHIKSVDPLAPKYLCPAPIDEALAEQLQALAVQAFEAIGCLDVARVDIKLDAEGQPVLMEINTLPGLNPTYSDIVMAARAEGVSYNTLVLEVLQQAIRRYRLDAA